MKSIHIHNTEPNNGHKDHQQVHAEKKKKKKKKAASQISTRQSSSEKTCYFSTHYRHLGAILFPLSSRVRGAFSAGNVRATNCCLPRRRVVKKHWGSGYFRCLLWLVALCICCFSPSRSLSLSLSFSPSHTHSNTHVCTCTVVDVSRWGPDWGWLGFCSLYFHIKDVSYWWSLTHIILQQHNRYGRAFIKHTCRRRTNRKNTPKPPHTRIYIYICIVVSTHSHTHVLSLCQTVRYSFLSLPFSQLL